MRKTLLHAVMTMSLLTAAVSMPPVLVGDAADSIVEANFDGFNETFSNQGSQKGGYGDLKVPSGYGKNTLVNGSGGFYTKGYSTRWEAQNTADKYTPGREWRLIRLTCG